MIPLLFFATCGAPDISDDWLDDYEVVQSTTGEVVEADDAVEYQVDGVFEDSRGLLSFIIPEGWQAAVGTGELLVGVTHLSSGTVVSFYRYEFGVGLPVSRADCEWSYTDPSAASPFRGVDSVLLTSCLIHESGDRVQALGFGQGDSAWQVEARLKVGYLALGLEVSEELFSAVSF